MPISSSSGHPIAGGDVTPTEFFVAADGTFRQPRADGLLAGTILPRAQGGTGTASNPATLANKPNDPTASASVTSLMMGLGSAWTITPVSSGKVMIVINGEVTTAVAAVSATVGARYNSGTAPANGAAVTGNAFGSKADYTTTPPGIGLKVPFAFSDILTLTVGTAYWFDLAVATANVADAASVSNLSISAHELW